MPKTSRAGAVGYASNRTCVVNVSLVIPAWYGIDQVAEGDLVRDTVDEVDGRILRGAHEGAGRQSDRAELQGGDHLLRDRHDGRGLSA